jgi:hypothetical protein
MEHAEWEIEVHACLVWQCELDEAYNPKAL